MDRDSGATVPQGTYGHWWSQGADSNTYARNLAIYGNYTAPEGNYYKTYGFPVRCVGSTRVNDILHQFPFSLPYGRLIDSATGQFQHQGVAGYAWTAKSDTVASKQAFYLYITGQHTIPDAPWYKATGTTVRSTRVNDILHQFPFSLPYSGYVLRESGATTAQGVYGNFWSANSRDATSAHLLYNTTTNTSPDGWRHKTIGFSVRCDQGSTRVNDILHQFPFSLPYSGYVASESGATVIQGTVGTWWSQGARSNTYARDLALLGNYTGPENNNYKTIGYSVRCVVFLPSVVEAGSIYLLFSE